MKSGRGRPSGRLRVSAPLMFAHVTLGPLAAAFAAAFPDVTLEVTTEDRFVDLIADDVDVVIRANPKPDSAIPAAAFCAIDWCWWRRSAWWRRLAHVAIVTSTNA